jgi:hypothetical protein
MARSKQTKATGLPATPATTSARKTQTSQPTSEDPPDQGSRRPRTSASAKNSQNKQAAQQNDDDAEDEESDDEEVLQAKARIRALARGASTVAHAEKGIEEARRVIQDGWNGLLGENTDEIFKIARYNLKVLKQRSEELNAALPTASSSSNNPDRVGKSKGKGKDTPLSVPDSHRPASNAPVAESEGEDEPGDDTQQPPLSRSPRRKDGEASQGANPPPQRTWVHATDKNWLVRGIKRESGKRYLIAWRPTDGLDWEDSWQGKSLVNLKTKRDWIRRKRNKKMWEEVDGLSEVEYL